jgi:ABC-type bacteriocin/lantibiotic exporter with double-glycine peptidase domain
LKVYLTLRAFAKLTVLALLPFFASCASSQSAKNISLEQIRFDKACGPRCLWALMQITGEGNTDCNINCIYELIGKEPLSVTSLKDIKDAAQKLGFSAIGYKLEIKDLEKMHGYAILPIGNAAGTPKDPLHFILVKQVTKDYIIIINSRTLEMQTIRNSKLIESWDGYALIVSIDKRTVL